MKILYVAWKDQEKNQWRTVGRLCCENGKYIFCYTDGAHAQSFIPFGRMTDLNFVYIADDLFPIFENRLLSKNRPEFKNLLNWLALDSEPYDPLDVLALTEGKRGTDSLEIFSHPTSDHSGVMKINFFSHGLRHISNWASENLKKLNEGSPLFLCPDPQNKNDENAIIIRSDDPISFVGYCPRYLTNDFLGLLSKTNKNDISVSVKRINLEAPDRYKVLCTMSVKSAGDFKPFSSQDFTPIVKNISSQCPHTQEGNAVCAQC
ncbi:MAG: HIRAN domain-containing protein [Desulfovibrionaceae bacterium]|nr:HIRAN domain-containing protein [Desulfovibrionaceae bacterium]